MSPRRPPGRHRATRRRPPWRALGAIASVVAVLASAAIVWAVATEGPDLAVAIAPAGDTVRTGDDASFRVTVSNVGRGTVEGADLLLGVRGPTAVPEAAGETFHCNGEGPVTCVLRNLEEGAEVVVEVSFGVLEPGSVGLDAVIEASADDEPGNDQASVELPVDGPACEVVGTSDPDVLVAAAGGSVVCGLGGQDRLSGGPGDDMLLGGSGADLAVFEDAAGPVTVDLQAGTASGQGDDSLEGIEGAIGSAYDDTLRGDAGQNVLDGGPGDDTLVGLAGDDSLAGGEGHDLLDLSGAPEGVRVSLAAGTSSGEGADALDGVEAVTGSPHDDIISGDAAPNALAGGDGDDVLNGLGGDDRLDGGEGDDAVSFAGAPVGVAASLATGRATGHGEDELIGFEEILGSARPDALTGSDGADRLAGLGGADSLSGGDGDDRLVGGAGDDGLVGGAGDDRLDGGPGQDGCVQGEPGGAGEGRCETDGFAEFEGVALFPISAGVVGVGFHESLFGSAVDMRPLGTLEQNANPSRFSQPPETDGGAYVVMGGRGRAAGATSSVDIVVPSRSPVLSPVTGTVVTVRAYQLYCKYGDYQVLIRPTGRPDLLVMVLHVSLPPVSEGDLVVAGVTPVGTSWGNDAPDSQANTYFPDQYPHVHIEVERGTEVGVPGCL